MQSERKPVEAYFPRQNAKKRHLRRHTRKGWTFPPGNRGIWGGIRGESGGNRGNLGELLAPFARMKIIRPHRSGRRGEFSFGVTSHKNYYVNSRVKNEETSAFETN